MGELSSAEQVKLLCSIPGIHHNVVSFVDTLNAFVSEARNNEVRLQRRVDELAGLVLDLRQEMKSLKESAIMAVKQPFSKSELGKEIKSAGDTGLLPVSVKPVFGATAANAGPNQDTLPTAAGSVEPETGNTEREEVDAINDDSWQLVAAAPPRRRRAVVFVGNLSSTCTMEGLTEFVHRRSVAATGNIIDVHSCNVHTAASGKVSARVTNDAACLATVTAANFWPRPLYCRTWKFNPPKKSSGNDKAHSSSDGGSGDGNDNAHSSSDGGSGDDSSGNDCGSGGSSSSDGGSGDGNDNAHSSRDDGSGDDSSRNDCGRSGSSSRRNSSSDSSPKPGAELTRTPGQKSRPHQRGSPAEDQAAKRVAPVSKQ
ncbi:uncharacterized protein LOC135829232 [Sycon ciliatum]|uniref:uncharacterized protein LOC135829232 n=1 Tax=Sycon ciliatum TaxID=27933 RepID=UPI0031F6766F